MGLLIGVGGSQVIVLAGIDYDRRRTIDHAEKL